MTCITFDYLLKHFVFISKRVDDQSTLYPDILVTLSVTWYFMSTCERRYIQKARSERHKPIRERLKSYQTQWGIWGWRQRMKIGEEGKAEIKGWTAWQRGHRRFKNKDRVKLYLHCLHFHDANVPPSRIPRPNFHKGFNPLETLCDWILLPVWVWKLRTGAGSTLVWHGSSCSHDHR